MDFGIGLAKKLFKIYKLFYKQQDFVINVVP